MALIRAVIGYESRKMCLIVYRGFDWSIIRSAQLQNNAVPTPVLNYVMSIYAIFCQLFQLFGMMMMMTIIIKIIIIIMLGLHSNLSVSRFVQLERLVRQVQRQSLPLPARRKIPALTADTYLNPLR